MKKGCTTTKENREMHTAPKYTIILFFQINYCEQKTYLFIFLLK